MARDKQTPTPEQLENVYREQVDWRAPRRGPVPPPAPDGTKTMVMVCGPMGAGKSNTAESYKAAVQDHFESHSDASAGTRGFVHFDMDEMRVWYPGYTDLARGVRGGLSVGRRTQGVAADWFNRSVVSALDGERNVVVEGSRPYKEIMREAKARDYRVVVATVVCSEAEARSGVLNRYLRQTDESKLADPEGEGYGRNVPTELQRKTFSSLLDDLKVARDERLADEIHFHERFSRQPAYSVRIEARDPGEELSTASENGVSEASGVTASIDEPFRALRDARWTPEYAELIAAQIERMGDHPRVRGSETLGAEYHAIHEMAQDKIKEARSGAGREAGLSAGGAIVSRGGGSRHGLDAEWDSARVAGRRSRDSSQRQRQGPDAGTPPQRP